MLGYNWTLVQEGKKKAMKNHLIELGNDAIRKLLKTKIYRIKIIFQVKVWNYKIQEITILRKV